MQVPPVNYIRIVEIQVMDVFGRPLPGVMAEVHPTWGKLLDKKQLVSNDKGIIRFSFKPVVDEPWADKKIRDRVIVYKSQFVYSLSKPGYIAFAKPVVDEQEFVAFSEPIYEGLNRVPSEKPLQLNAELATFTDFLKQPSGGERLKALVEQIALRGDSGSFNLTPKSLDLTSGGLLSAGIEFNLLFDPSEMALISAGAALLTKPAASIIKTIKEADPAIHVKKLNLQVEAGFQYRENPFALPEKQIFTFVIPEDAFSDILNWTEGKHFPLEKITVSVNGEVIDLSSELNPEEYRKAPGDLLSTGK